MRLQPPPGATHTDFRAAAAGATPAEMECSLSMDSRSTARDVQAKVNAVLEGNLNPCGDALADLRSVNVSLSRIESDPEGDGRLVFRVLKVGYGEYHTP